MNPSYGQQPSDRQDQDTFSQKQLRSNVQTARDGKMNQINSNNRGNNNIGQERLTNQSISQQRVSVPVQGNYIAQQQQQQNQYQQIQGNQAVVQPSEGQSNQQRQDYQNQDQNDPRRSSKNSYKQDDQMKKNIVNQIQQGQQTYNKSETHTHLYKIVLVGDAGVGKTHIINRYVKGQIPHTIIPTIGIEFATKTVTLRDGGTIKTQIWDTAGQEKYRSITSAHYRKAVGALLVYDVTKEKTFESIKRWLEEIRQHADRDIVLMLVGNKVDITNEYPQQRRVSKEESAQFAKDNCLLFEESSALLDVNINDAFEKLLEEIYDRKCRLQSERSVVQTETDDPKKAKIIFDLNLPPSNSAQNSSICSCN